MHDQHFRSLDEICTRLSIHNFQEKLKKCVFGSSEMSYLGFRLTKSGIFPGSDKLKAVKDANLPENVKQIQQF